VEPVGVSLLSFLYSQDEKLMEIIKSSEHVEIILGGSITLILLLITFCLRRRK
jgi:hypothetical protein